MNECSALTAFGWSHSGGAWYSRGIGAREHSAVIGRAGHWAGGIGAGAIRHVRTFGVAQAFERGRAFVSTCPLFAHGDVREQGRPRADHPGAGTGRFADVVGCSWSVADEGDLRGSSRDSLGIPRFRIAVRRECLSDRGDVSTALHLANSTWPTVTRPWSFRAGIIHIGTLGTSPDPRLVPARPVVVSRCSGRLFRGLEVVAANGFPASEVGRPLLQLWVLLNGREGCAVPEAVGVVFRHYSRDRSGSARMSGPGTAGPGTVGSGSSSRRARFGPGSPARAAGPGALQFDICEEVSWWPSSGG